LELLASGDISWGLDEDEDIFEKYGVPYQPVTVLITADMKVADSWPGALPEDEIRARLDRLLELSG
jgi:thioredoxin-like negative regulator of GroEL